jgi:hypothetical protein
MKTLIVLLVIMQIMAIVAHGYILVLYKRYCGHCDWWWDVGAAFHFIVTFIPVISIIAPVVGSIDYIRNVADETRRKYGHCSSYQNRYDAQR